MEKNTYIYGIHAINEALNSGEEIEKLFYQKGLQNPALKEIESLARTNSIQISYVPIEKLNKLSKNNNHQGLIAKISPIEFVDIEDLISSVDSLNAPPLFLVLDQITDVRNFGAIIRTAECSGVNGIIISRKGSAPINADTIKTSAGAVFTIPICKVDHIKDALFHLQASNIQLVAATEKTEDLIYDVSFKPPTALIMGSEGSGITPSILKLVDKKAKLPLLGSIESLNVSVACGAILYEALRQRL